ncbi:hypothetical protein FZI85_03990 [Mycobacterium sp. CBMA293]|uniref:bestrophin-like domain n=1 Tax=unclassified Mycolicibacterium TaxID=2636767 RepID=UPI0012DF777B|nr:MULTISPECIES: hypothetical protein [unclassified Mycolicibacterium]MUL47096.1 hypothetical protein [Mycolicibacterium sp. CBMA 360]MUL58473.1 hypothetical protein [Mycolicibacterium sp. CBMA 335]MUL73931.1 hypothetical protein [Mycolicibacterium sp. CBMA 311]MUL93356.1 hypothetical protein [Mycolicibacterium sp. CBMA 230]MUM07903.1 hypothetical protein [Mycolicibacterium sp. CBMA 213]
MFILLCGSTALGFLLKSQFLERFAQETALDSMGLIISFLVTITAIVVGLLINTAKSFIDATQRHWAILAGQLIRLDQSLRNYGAGAEPMRRQLQSFTAAAIVKFWRAEDIPIEVDYPDVRAVSKREATHEMSHLLNSIELGIIQLKPGDPLHERLAIDCFDQFKDFSNARLSLLLTPQNTLPAPFLKVLVSWIMIIFVCFGLRAPANPLVIIAITLSATTLSGMVFAIIDVVDPYKGLYNISSKNMHYALEAMLRCR